MFVRDSCSKQLDSDRLAAYVPDIFTGSGRITIVILVSAIGGLSVLLVAAALGSLNIEIVLLGTRSKLLRTRSKENTF